MPTTTRTPAKQNGRNGVQKTAAAASVRTTGAAVARPPQQARSRETRRKLLEAALSCVAELGYAGATMDQVVERAGVSRGAQGHHFPTKSLLMQESLTYMLDGMVEDLQARTEQIRHQELKPAAVFQHLWDAYFSNRLFSVTIELIVAARTDAELRAVLTPVTERFHRQVDDCFYVLNRENHIDSRRINLAVNLTISLMRGMGVQTILFNRPEHFQALLGEWFGYLNTIFIGPEGAGDNGSTGPA